MSTCSHLKTPALLKDQLKPEGLLDVFDTRLDQYSKFSGLRPFYAVGKRRPSYNLGLRSSNKKKPKKPRLDALEMASLVCLRPIALFGLVDETTQLFARRLTEFTGNNFS